MNDSKWFVNSFAHDIWLRKYAGEFADAGPRAYFSALADRVSLGDDNLAAEFFRLMWSKRFIPGGRILAFGGRPDAKVSLMNCTTFAVEGDSLEDISTAGFTIMRSSSRGQGIGLDLSKLRPAGTPVNNAALTSTGAISFMEMLNAIGSTIGQQGRRGALLFSLNITHPDVWRPDDPQGYDFLRVKNIPGKVENANISVMITDDFMQAVLDDQEWALRYQGTSGDDEFEYTRVVSARELFRALAESAHASAEPGVLFWDTSKRMSNSDLFGSRWAITGVNACSEMVLDQSGVCNLGSMNLYAYVTDPFSRTARFDYASFARDVAVAVEFLDNALTVEHRRGSYTNDQQARSIVFLRRVGLGVMGLADAIAAQGMLYGTWRDTSDFIAKVFSTLRDAAYNASVELAAQKGPALAWEFKNVDRKDIVEKAFYGMLPEGIKQRIVEHGLRNVTLLSVAPTGSISNLVGVSSGIEPLFALEYTRRHRINGDDEFIQYVHPQVELSRENLIPDSLWVTAYQLSPQEHVMVQAIAQRYIDESISKTVNFPPDATVEDVEQAYMLAWTSGLKGLSVYVDGSRHEQILYQKESCPQCGADVIRKEGCKECPTCGWSVCTI